MSKNNSAIFDKIIKTNKHKIYRICSIYAIQPIEPEDLFQEVLFAIWKSLPAFKNQSSIDTWVYRVTLNICMRAKQQIDKRNLNTTRLESIAILPTKETVDEAQQAKQNALMSCISTLEDLDKSIVILSLDGLKYKAIAEITGLTENHVAVKMKRIKQQLKTCITSKL